MSEERTYKRGQLAELQDEDRAVSAKIRAAAKILSGIFCDPGDFNRMDLDMALVTMKDLKDHRERYREISSKIMSLRKELNLI